MVSKSVFLQKIERLCAAFGNSFSDESVAIYYEKLSGAFGDDDFSDITEMIIETEKRFPSISVFLDIKKQVSSKNRFVL